MIPSLVKRIVLTTAVVAGVISLYLSLSDVKSCYAFSASVAWMLANVFVWGKLIVTAFNPVRDKAIKVAVLVVMKVALLVAGIVMLNMASPLTKGQALGVVGGISLVFLVVTLKAMGARMTGRDLFTAQKLTGRNA